MSLPGPQGRRPFHLLAKPVGAACNLDCAYCFFLSKEVLWDGDQRMDDRVLRRFLEAYLDAQPDGDVAVGWQGGEPTLRGLPFFREAVRLTDELRRPGQRVQHAIQTNGTLLDDEWGAFLAEKGVLVGLSLDGPAALHDVHRVNRSGRGSHAQAVRGWEVLRRHGVDTNILCTVNAANQSRPLEVYRHFRDDLGAEFLQFIPILERVLPGQRDIAEAGWRDAEGRRVLYTQSGDEVTSRSVDPDAWGAFLIAIFDEWVQADVGRVFVQHFDVTLGAAFGQYSLCVHSPVCGGALAMEPTGDVYSCDHYVEPGYRLGNVADASFGELLDLPEQRAFGLAKRTALPRQCLDCSVRWACHGGCPKDRFDTTPDGEPGLNHLCRGYYAFFDHVTPAMRRLAVLVRAGRPAADIMVEA